MKIVIDGKSVIAKTIENLGWQSGYQSKVIEYKGKEYIIIKENGVWRTRTPEDKWLRLIREGERRP